MTAFADAVAQNCWAEYERWAKGAGRETVDPYCQYVGEYWKTGLKISGIDGRTTFQDAKHNSYRPAWSAAFVSFIMRKSGAGANFLYSEAHIHYAVKAIQDAKKTPPTAKFLGRDPTVYAPKIGDLLTAGRGAAASVTYGNVLQKYGTKAPPNGNFMPSHTDIVVKVDVANKKLTTIGGNVTTDTCNTKTWTTKANGTLTKGSTLICVIECLL